MAVDLVTVGMKRTDDGDLVRDPDEQLTAEELNAIVVALNEGITAGNDNETIIADLRTSLGLTGPLAVPGDETVTAAIDRIDAALVASINDGTVSDASAWSSEKVETEIGAAITALVGAAPETLNTLQELAALLQSEAGLIDALQTIAQSNTDAIAEVRQDFEAADAIHTTGISDNANDIAQVRTDFEAADAVLTAADAQARTDFEAADATHTANIATNAAAIVTNATNISTNGADIATARTDFEAADAVHTADIAALVTRVLALETDIYSFTLPFSATSSLTHRIDTEDAAGYVANYPNGLIVNVASGVTHTQALPANTSGVVTFIITGGPRAVRRLDIGNDPWSFDLSRITPLALLEELTIVGSAITITGGVADLPTASLTRATVSASNILIANFESTSSLIHRFDTVGAASYTATYPDSSVETIASGATHTQALPANTSGVVEFNFTDGVTSVRQFEPGDSPWSFDLAVLSPMTSLTLLRIVGNAMPISGSLSALSSLTGLSSLYLYGNAMTIGGDVSGLSALTSLTFLYLRGNAITISGDMSALSPLTALTYLKLHGPSMALNGDGTFLSSMSALAQLNLFDANLPSATVDDVINAASTMPLVTLLHISGTNGSRTAASDAGAALIAGRGVNFLYNGRTLYDLYTDRPAWLEAAYDFGVLSSLALSSGKVTQANDLSGNARHATQVVASQQPPYLASDARVGGLAAVGPSTTLGVIGLSTPEMTLQRVCASIQYKDGVDSTFDNFSRFIEVEESGGGTKSVSGTIGNDVITATGGYSNSMRVNAGAESSIVLPMPLSSAVASTEPAITGTINLAYSLNTINRNWDGSVRRWAVLGSSSTTSNVELWEGFSAWRDGTQDDLVLTHPHRVIPPFSAAVAPDLSLSFTATSSVIHRFDTVGGKPYRAKYPDGTIVNVASGVEHTQTLPANTSGVVEFNFTDGVESVTRFDLGSSPWSFDVSALSPLTALAHLSFIGSALTIDGNLSSLSALTSITYLRISGNAITIDGDLSALSPLTSLTYLNIIAGAMTIGGDLSALSPLTALAYLNIISNAMTIGGNISSLSALTSLTSLRISGNAMTIDGDLSALSPLTSLTYLYVSGNAMTPSGGGTFLSSMSALTQLYLISLSLSPATIDDVINTAADLPQLMTIHLDGTNGDRTAASDAGAALITGRGATFLYNGRPLYNLYTDQPAWLEAAYDFGVLSSLALSNGNVSQADDLSGNARHATQVVASQQPPYLASDARANGLAAVGSDSTLDYVGLLAPSMTVSSVVTSVGYKNGTESTFTGEGGDYHRLFSSSGTNGRYYVVGNPEAATLFNSPTDGFSATARVNGSAASATVLPLPLSVLTMKSSTPRTQDFALGYRMNQGSESWAGPQRRWLFLSDAALDADRDKVEGFSAWRDGIQDSLDPAHPYRNAPPLA